MSRRIRSDSLPRLRAEISPLMKGAKLSTQGVSSQADEDGNYGVQARRRGGEAAGQSREARDRCLPAPPSVGTGAGRQGLFSTAC